MIVAGRRISSSTRNKLHSKLKLSSSLSLTSHSGMASPPQPSSPLCTDTPLLSPLPTKSTSGGEWAADLFTGDCKSRAISALGVDRDNSRFSFKQYGKACRKAAVLVPFCYDMEGRPGILLNLRSEHLNVHRGEISFPGGTLEPEDNGDPITAALRETHEELGICKDEVEVWTMCRVFPTVSTKMGVIPVLGFLKSGPVDPDKLEINPDEVDHAFIVTFDHLCNPSNWAEMDPPRGLGSLTLPIYRNMNEMSSGLQDIHLWGLTAFVTHLVLAAFIPERYTRKVSYIELMSGTGKEEKKELAETSSTNDKSNSVSKL